jgi:opacity protein-like surface antigen
LSRRIVALAAAVSLTVAAAAATSPAHAAYPAGPTPEPNIYLALDFWRASFSGDGQTGGGSSDERFDFNDTLGLESSSTVRALDSFVRFQTTSIIFGYAHGSYRGTNRLDSDLVYDGRTFVSGAKVRSHLDYDHVKLLYGRPFLEGRLITAALRAGLYEYRMGSEVNQSGVGEPNVDIHTRVPVLGAAMTIRPTPAIRIQGEILAMKLDRSGTNSTIKDAYTSLDYLLIQGVAIRVGYRYSAIEAKEKDNAEFDLKEHGTFLGVALSF